MSRKHGPSGLKSHVASEVAYGDVIGYWCIGVLGAPSAQSQEKNRWSLVIGHWGQGFGPAYGTEIPPPIKSVAEQRLPKPFTIHHSSRSEVVS